MARKSITDRLWQRIESLLPERKSPGPKGGRPPIDDRIVLEAIMFMLESGIPWRLLPRQFKCSRMTCWRRIRDWQELGVWDELHGVLLTELQRRGKIRWSRFVVDSSSVRALEGGQNTGKNPTDRARRGTKHHVLVDGKGIPIAIRITGANRHDVTQMVPLVKAVPALRGKQGRPRQRPKRLFADRAYDSQSVRRFLRQLKITPYLAKRNTEHGSGLGKYRWVVERTISWLHGLRRLRMRWERRADIHQALLTLAACVICVRFLVA